MMCQLERPQQMVAQLHWLVEIREQERKLEQLQEQQRQVQRQKQEKEMQLWKIQEEIRQVLQKKEELKRQLQQFEDRLRLLEKEREAKLLEDQRQQELENNLKLQEKEREAQLQLQDQEREAQLKLQEKEHKAQLLEDQRLQLLKEVKEKEQMLKEVMKMEQTCQSLRAQERNMRWDLKKLEIKDRSLKFREQVFCETLRTLQDFESKEKSKSTSLEENKSYLKLEEERLEKRRREESLEWSHAFETHHSNVKESKMKSFQPGPFFLQAIANVGESSTPDTEFAKDENAGEKEPTRTSTSLQHNKASKKEVEVNNPPEKDSSNAILNLLCCCLGINNSDE